MCLGKEIVEGKCDTPEGKVAGDEDGRKEGRKGRMDTAKGKKRRHESRAAAAALLFDFALHVLPWAHGAEH